MQKALGNKQTLFYSIAVLAALAVGLFLLSSSNKVVLQEAQAASASLSGYAWSDNIGWIDFSGVSVSDAPNFVLSGYAWSNNLGWITFNQSDMKSSCPAGTCRAVLTNAPNYRFSGWARACGIYKNNCAGALDQSGDWSGWIDLGARPQPGTPINPSTTQLNGHAWGSELMGWISFSGTAPNYGVRVGVTPPGCTLSQVNGPKIHWTSTGATSGEIRSGANTYTMSPLAAGNTPIVTPGTYRAFLDGSATASCNVVVSLTPPQPGTVDLFKADPTLVRKITGVTNLSWHASDVTSCTITSSPTGPSVPPSIDIVGGVADGSGSASNFKATTQLTFSCIGTDGNPTNSKSVTIHVVPDYIEQ